VPTLVALDGVLRAPNGNPIPEGRVLFECLKKSGPVVVLADTAMSEAEHWLRLNNVIFDNLVCADGVDSVEPLRYRQIRFQRSLSRVDFLVDSDPEVINWALSEGIMSLFFVHPQFAAPVSRRDSNKGRRSWEEIGLEIDRRQKIAASVAKERNADL